MNATEIALAFNQNNSKKLWTARASSRPQDGLDAVHFQTKTGLITLIYNTLDGRFQVKFNKYQSSFGDYIKAIARSLHHILSTLKSAGLPFEAPPSAAGIVIEATSSDDNSVYARWPGATVQYAREPLVYADVVALPEGGYRVGPL